MIVTNAIIDILFLQLFCQIKNLEIFEFTQHLEKESFVRKFDSLLHMRTEVVKNTETSKQ